MINVYNATVLPHFDYCSFVWDNCSIYLQEKLQNMQNRTDRVITGRSYEEPYADVLKEIGWQSLEDRKKFNKLIFMHKVKCKARPRIPWPVHLMLTVNPIYNPRSNNTASYALQKLNIVYIAYSGDSVWNSSSHRNIKRKQYSLVQFRTILSGN